MPARNVTRLRSDKHDDPANDPAVQAECELRIALSHIRIMNQATSRLLASIRRVRSAACLRCWFAL
jgi:hypothetical protein